MCRSCFSILALVMGAGSATAIAPNDITASQRVAVETDLARDAVVNQTPLHDSTRHFSDGVRGNEGYFNADGMIRQIEPPLTTRTEEDLYSLLCSEDEIMLARAQGSSAHLSASGTFIYTTTRFQIVDVIKSKSGKQLNDTISGVDLGGEVDDAGERLRDSYNGLHPYFEGQLYLLTLGPPIAGSDGIFKMPFQVTVAEQTGALKLQTYGVSGYETKALQSEPTFAEFRNKIGKVAALKECWKPRTPH